MIKKGPHRGMILELATASESTVLTNSHTDSEWVIEINTGPDLLEDEAKTPELEPDPNNCAA